MMSRTPIPTWYFALVVVRRANRFLMVHERKHGQLWYLPAGRVEAGETCVMAAVRETFEETGIAVRLVGILRVEHSPGPRAARLRVVFLAEPVDDTLPKSDPDDESLEAAWVTLEELDRYPLRGDEVRDIFAYVEAGGPIYPVSLLQQEGMSWTNEGTG